jgi:seryl-tRNA synthetase
MLDLALLRAEPARLKAALARRGVAAEAVDAVVDLDGHWSARLEVREALRHRRRRISEEVALAKREARDTADLEREARRTGDELAAIEAEVARLEARRDAALLALPNLPMTDVPDQSLAAAAYGRDYCRPSPYAATAKRDTPDEPPERLAAAGTAANVSAAPPWPNSFAPLAHWGLLELLGLAPALGRPPGRGFLIWRGRGARLVRALVEFMLDVHTREFGYEEVRVPALATREALTGSAHLPTLADKMYAVDSAGSPSEPAARLSEPAAPGGMPTPPLRGHVPGAAESMPTEKMPGACRPALFLAPRAEPHLANLYADRTLAGAQLPERFVAAGRAFRREAGAGGTHGRGLLRLHEFDTVELYTFCRPDQDAEELDRAVRAAETILERLEVPHRRSLRAARNLSHAAAKTWDLEVGAPGIKEWLSVAALSTFADYQARRTNTRYFEPGPVARPRLVHTIGGAAVALPRLIAAILENHQQADGSVRLPAALAPYLGGEATLAVSAKP